MNEFIQKLLELDNTIELSRAVIDYDIISGAEDYVVVNRFNGKRVSSDITSTAFIALVLHVGIIMNNISQHYNFIPDVFCHMPILRIERKPD